MRIVKLYKAVVRRFWKPKILCGLLLLLSLSNSSLVSAHGVQLQYEEATQYKLVAAFDNGEPMNEAQVTVYAPHDPTQPWATGMTDEEGVYDFIPDHSLPGHWTIQVRKAGHGGNLSIEVSENETKAGDASYSTSQLILMIGCVVWGLIGTALYFRRRS